MRRRVLFRTFFHDFFVQQMALTMILTLQKCSKKKKEKEQSREKHDITSNLITITPNIFGLCPSISHFLKLEWVTVTPIDKKLHY